MLAIITAIAIASSVPAPTHTEVAPKQVAIVYEEQTAFYNLTENKKKRK